ncbi:MAG: hypothetical protein KTR20_07490 [Cellvibrionaceae bacterium]|nr:hypothetical protein [Cellvibrionaceae bacterium]
MQIYLVGGAVRDQLLNLPVKEKDWLVVGATVAQLTAQGFRPVGKDFPVFLHPDTQEEYALARTERKTAPGYTGFVFHADASVTLEDDLRRRDLTINAIARDGDDQLIDPYRGVADIQQRCLRHVSPAFSEDPVRILRLARFYARFYYLGFQVAPETLALIKTMVAAGETHYLVPERVWQEWVKALAERDPACFFDVLVRSESMASIFPEIDEALLPACIDNLLAVSAVVAEPLLRFAGFCCALPAPAVIGLCQRLGVPNAYGELALLACRHGQCLYARPQPETVAALLRATDALRRTQRFTQLLTVAECLAPSPMAVQAFWQQALSRYQQVDPQALMAQGYTQAALGKAIAEQRLGQLRLWLEGQGFETQELKEYGRGSSGPEKDNG